MINKNEIETVAFTQRNLLGDWKINGDHIATKKWVLGKLVTSFEPESPSSPYEIIDADGNRKIVQMESVNSQQWREWVANNLKSLIKNTSKTQKIIKEIITIEKPIEHTKETIIKKELVEKDCDNIQYIYKDSEIESGHAGKYIIVRSDDDVTITLSHYFKRGQEVTIFREGGNVIFKGTNGVKILGVGNKIAYPFGCVTLKNIETDMWHLIGALN